MEPKQQAEWVMEQSLGKGAFGVVTLWIHKESGAKIAIKTFKDTKNEEWYKSEKELMERLNHKNLVNTVPIPAQFHRLSSRILCMEYCSAGNLRKILNQPENCCGIPEVTIRKCMKDVKDALEYLHLSQNISHRDLKPENIVLHKTQDEETFKLIDLGFGKHCDSTLLQTSLVGTNGYVAPEVFLEEVPLEGYSSSVDYWSLGVICHEMVTGYLPFLPHMRKSPAKWMGKVRFKTDEVISVYETLYGRNDDLVFSEHLSRENHVTEAFARKLEVWLKLALRWDYRKRGRDRQGQLIIFSSLEDMIAKKIVTVFSAATYVFLSYEINDSTTALEIKHLIFRDTQQPIENQVLLLPSGETVRDELKLAEHWDPTLVAMLYVFSKEGISLPLEPASPPPALTSLLEEHKEPLSYHKRKRACSSAIHFLQTQLSLCEAFYEALAAVVLSLVNGMKQLSNQEYLVRDEIVSCAARLEVLKDSILYNEKRYNREQKARAVRGGENFLEDAKTKMKSFRSAAKQLKDQLLRDSSSLQEIQVKLTEASAFESTDSAIKDMKNSLEKGYHIIKNLLVMPKELRESEENCSEIVEVVLNFLEIMDSFINDGRLRETVDKAKECKNMTNGLIPKFRNRSIDVKNVNRDIALVEVSLFKAVWDLLLPPKDSPSEAYVAPFSNALVEENLLLHRQFEESFARQREEFSCIKERYKTVTTEFPTT